MSDGSVSRTVPDVAHSATPLIAPGSSSRPVTSDSASTKPAMQTSSHDRPWDATATAITFSWIMTEDGLRMQWTPVTSTDERIRAQ